MPAFEAAVNAGVGIECDVRPSRDQRPIVFHDETTDRLLGRPGRVADLTERQLTALPYPASARPTCVMPLASLFGLVAGRVPIFVEVKSDWRPPNAAFIAGLAELLRCYPGTVAVMSFDPTVLSALAETAPDVPRGLVAANFAPNDPLCARIGLDRTARLARLAEIGAGRPAFVAYEVGALPTPETRHARDTLGIPLIAWTVRSEDHWRKVHRFADAAVFEGMAPTRA